MDTVSGTREVWMAMYDDVFVILIVIFEVGRKETCRDTHWVTSRNISHFILPHSEVGHILKEGFFHISFCHSQKLARIKSWPELK